MTSTSEHIHNIDSTHMVDLVSLNKGHYQRMRGEKLPHLMVGFKYIVVSKRLKDIIETIQVEGISFSPVKIMLTNKVAADGYFFEMAVQNTFNSSDYAKIATDGCKMYVMDSQYLFVTHSIREALEAYELDLEFSVGLSNFG